jgi:uncharacterized protein (DUF1800 family)
MRRFVTLAVVGAVWINAWTVGFAVAQTPVRSTQSPDFNPTVDAARLLAQGAFGANRTEIDRVARIGANAWLNEQFAKPQTLHVDTVLALRASGTAQYGELSASIWKQFFEGSDQLRQRTAFALSQILVVSTRNDALQGQPCAPASYLDMLGKHAFGNFRDVLKDATLHPAMGEYLDMKRSGKALTLTNPDGTTFKFYPNENYARELLQLFSIGTVQLNLDGTPKLDSAGKTIPSYDESVVKGFAQAFTGWTFAPDKVHDTEWNTPGRWANMYYPSDTIYPDENVRQAILCGLWKTPMAPWTITREQNGKYDICNQQTNPDYNTCPKPDLPPPHDTGTKKLLNNVIIPANQTPMQDIDAAVDNIFNHPNVGPFIGKQLIQRLTMSNPQAPYVERVAKAFNNNGSGVRGDMKAVLRAILLDPDVRLHIRSQGPLAGKLKEPVVRFVSFLRAFDAKPSSGLYALPDFSDPTDLYQNPMRAPSVFNFYRPDNPLPGQPANSPVLAPEFALATTNAVTGWADFSANAMIRGYGTWLIDSPLAGQYIKPDYSKLEPLTQTNIPKMIDELTMLLLGGTITPNFRARLIESASKVTIDQYTPPIERLYVALWLIVNSPEFLVHK